jgi:hypothetical protein
LNNLGQERYEEVSINGSKALVGNEVVAINHPNGQDWAIIHIAFPLLMRYRQDLSSKGCSPKNVPHLTDKRCNTTSDNQDYAADAGQFSHNNQVLLQQITASFRWKIP